MRVLRNREGGCCWGYHLSLFRVHFNHSPPFKKADKYMNTNTYTHTHTKQQHLPPTPRSPPPPRKEKQKKQTAACPCRRVLPQLGVLTLDLQPKLPVLPHDACEAARHSTVAGSVVSARRLFGGALKGKPAFKPEATPCFLAWFCKAQPKGNHNWGAIWGWLKRLKKTKRKLLASNKRRHTKLRD